MKSNNPTSFKPMLTFLYTATNKNIHERASLGGRVTIRPARGGNAAISCGMV